MSHRVIIESIAEKRKEALAIAARVQIKAEILGTTASAQLDPRHEAPLLRHVAEALELAAFDLWTDRLNEDEAQVAAMRKSAADAFRLLRLLAPAADDPLESAKHCLQTAALAVLGDMGADAVRWLKDQTWDDLPCDSANWHDRVWACILDVWLRLIRKNGWDDREAVLARVAALRDAQGEFERRYLEKLPGMRAKSEALELIGLYHLAKAAEILALFITDGVVDGDHQVQQLLDAQFDRAIATGDTMRLVEFEPFTRLLAATAAQLVSNSLWTVTRAVNTRVTKFVKELTAKGRGDKVLFDVLPPQRRALAEKGLLGSSRRAVVVSLPTSSGKTLVAQFRMLQALNQFESEKGWVAYLAPTRALVNQIARRLRHDFEPLGIVVEQVSPALEVDKVEAALLKQSDDSAAFKILVTTPEKLDLMLRRDCQREIGRPLTLVIVDEAHNLQDAGESARGLKLELLLATINRECKYAQFLLLTPFINNAHEVARWLGGVNSDDISFALDWQPNDRVIGIVQPEALETKPAKAALAGGQGLLNLDDGRADATPCTPAKGRRYDYRLRFQSVHTTRPSLHMDETIPLSKAAEIADTFSEASNQGAVAAICAQHLQSRGPVIVMHTKPDLVWSLSEKLKISTNRDDVVSDEVRLAQDYLRYELGENFPLIELLQHGIGMHHGGLPDDVRCLMEWLFEKEKLKFLLATTTIAQGVNFPVSGVVMASHQYPYGNDMPPEDFWNIAGRAGRINHGQLGVVAIASESDEKTKILREFINKQTGDLNSALIQLAQEAQASLGDLGSLVYSKPAWSSFLQYLAHSYRQMGHPASYTQQVEQVLRGTLGFEKLRTGNSALAKTLLDGVRTYCDDLRKPEHKGPLTLVDSTGFSLQSIKTVLEHRGSIDETSWTPRLFDAHENTLREMMGILLRVPELRDNLKAVLGGDAPDGEKLALIVKDWVNGEGIPNIAHAHFQKEKRDALGEITTCCQNLFGKLAQTTSWGLGALLAITTAGKLSDEDFEKLRNFPSRVFYGVDNDAAITMRLLGIPRTAATPMAAALQEFINEPLPMIRRRLATLPDETWQAALGERAATYRRVWRILEGLRQS